MFHGLIGGRKDWLESSQVTLDETFNETTLTEDTPFARLNE